MTKLATATIKATGERVRYEVKQSWNALYYSFDNGVTWHRSKVKAYKRAAASAKLCSVSKGNHLTQRSEDE